MVNDEDRELLARAMSGVKPLKNKKADVSTSRTKIPEFTLRLRRMQATTEKTSVVDGLSDSHMIAIAPEEHIEHQRPGLQHGKLQKLRLGQLPVQYNLDLHGYTFEDARETVVHFINFCRDHHYTTVRIVHGKSHSSRQSERTMKSYVNVWLKQLPDVLGFASCLPVDGGTGAVYVLLRRLR